MKFRRLGAFVVACGVVAGAATTAGATTGNPINAGSSAPYTIAVIGDMPYATESDLTKVVELTQLIDQINHDPKVDLVTHLGDTKSGSTKCTDAWNAQILSLFQSFQDPLVYTPGDNEWTDCHRANNDHYLPTERLAAIRALYFPNPGETLGGRTKQVLTQADAGYVENVIWMESKTVFATLNLPGSNNDTAPWSPIGLGWTGVSDPTAYPTQVEEHDARSAADLAWVDQAFAIARERGAGAVVLALQADMWDIGPISDYAPFVQRIGAQAQSFPGPVLLLEGDSHVFRVDHPFTTGDPLHLLFPSTPEAPSVTRIVVEGDGNPTEYLRLTIEPNDAAVFSWERVPLAA
jgi:Calcineurin-like phosphoesterase